MPQQYERQPSQGRGQNYGDENVGPNERRNFTEPRYQNDDNPPGGGRGYGRGNYNQPGESETSIPGIDARNGQGYARGDYGQDYGRPRGGGNAGVDEGWSTPQRMFDYGQNPSWGSPASGRPEPRYSPSWWAAPGPYVGRGPQGWSRSKERILQDVCERMAQHGQLDASNIQVEVNDDEVTLSGNVGSRSEKRLAEELAESVWGVNDVNNQLHVSASNGERASNFDRDK